jgi:transcriptional regulatory protein LEU3
LLFWTIVLTAARHDSHDFSLLPALVPAVKKLLWLSIGTVPHMLPSLQAMSILCVWTFPTSSMPVDITFILAGILKSAAMHTGLHRPDILTHYSRVRSSLEPAKLRDAVKVWCCSYIAMEGYVALNVFLLSHHSTFQYLAGSDFAFLPTTHPFLLNQPRFSFLPHHCLDTCHESNHIGGVI